MTTIKRLSFVVLLAIACMPKPKSLEQVSEELSGRCVVRNDCSDAFRTCTEKDRYLSCVDTAEQASRNGQYERAIAFMTAGCNIHPYMCEQLGEFGAWQAGITTHYSFQRWSRRELDLAPRTLRLACSKGSAIGCRSLAGWIANTTNVIDDEAKAALSVACTHAIPFHVEGPLFSDVAGHDDEWFYVGRKRIEIGDAVAESCDILAAGIRGPQADLLYQRASYVRAEADAEGERYKEFEASQERARNADFDARMARLDQQIAEDQQYYAAHSTDIANNLAATRVAIEAIRTNSIPQVTDEAIRTTSIPQDPYGQPTVERRPGGPPKALQTVEGDVCGIPDFETRGASDGATGTAWSLSFSSTVIKFGVAGQYGGQVSVRPTRCRSVEIPTSVTGEPCQYVVYWFYGDLLAGGGPLFYDERDMLKTSDPVLFRLAGTCNRQVITNAGWPQNHTNQTSVGIRHP